MRLLNKALTFITFSKPGSSGRGVTLTGLIISASIITLLAVIIISQLLRSRIIANESAARTTLKTISTALETYAAEARQGYPADISILVTTNPRYLNNNYIAESPILGYNYILEFLEPGGYSFIARPQRCGQTGSKIYSITTGGALTDSDCAQ